MPQIWTCAFFSNWVARKKTHPKFGLMEMFAKKHPPEDIGPTLLGPKTIYKKNVTLYTLPETKPASLHLKMDGWNTIRLPSGAPIFQGFPLAVSFREGMFLP